MRAIFWLNGWLVRVLSVAAVLLVAAMMLGISAEVILRAFKFPSLIGLIELTEYALFISTFFIAPYLLRTNEHIRVDIFMSRVDPALARRVELGVLATIMVVSLITGAVAIKLMIASAQAGTLIFKDLIFPQVWLDWIIPLCSLVMFIQALELLIALGKAPPTQNVAAHIPGMQPEEMP